LLAKFKPLSPVLYFKQDNAAVIAQLEGIIRSRATISIGVKAAWLKEKHELGLLVFQWIKSELMLADIFTKPLTAVLLERYVNLLFGYAPEELYEALRAESTLPAARTSAAPTSGIVSTVPGSKSKKSKPKTVKTP
jgi:hypothetical protein